MNSYRIEFLQIPSRDPDREAILIASGLEIDEAIFGARKLAEEFAAELGGFVQSEDFTLARQWIYWLVRGTSLQDPDRSLLACVTATVERS